MKILDFPAALELAGVTVRYLDGYEDPARNGYVWREPDGDPAGHMHHHTATASYVPNNSKANAYAGLGRDGSARLYQENYGDDNMFPVYTIANLYPAPISSGAGDKSVLERVRAGIEVDGRSGSDTPNWYGNTHYWNTEWILNGIGAPIDQRVWNMMIVVCQVQNDVMDWTRVNHIGHGHHTRRKIDLFGGQFTDFDDTINHLRDDMDGDLPPIEPPTIGEHEMNTVKYSDGFRASREKQATVKALQIMLADNGFADDNTQDGTCAADGMFGRGTESSVKAFQKSKGLVQSGVCNAGTWAALEGWES